VDTPPITIRKATLDDVPRLSEIGATVYVHSYNYDYNQADMDAYLDSTFSKEQIIKELNCETNYYYVAETDSIIGFVKFKTWVWTPRFKGKITFEVERLYIQEDMEGKNIGSRLMQLTVEEGKKHNYTIIWLSVWENNTRAIAFHKLNGFEIIGDGIFKMGPIERKYLIMQLTN